jgi:hypothetical protein
VVSIIDDLPEYWRGGDWQLLDDDHAYLVMHQDGEPAGINEAHRRPDNGEVCLGWVPWGDRPGPTWRLVSLDPLHLEPSLLCRVCGSHGFIRGGKWVPA